VVLHPIDKYDRIKAQMKLPGFLAKLRPRPRPLSAEVVTALSQVQNAIDTLTTAHIELEKFAKETRTRTETVYRKVYRDLEKGDGDIDIQAKMQEFAKASLLKEIIIRPGDPPPEG